MDKNILKESKNILETLFKKTGMEIEIKVQEGEGDSLKILLKTEDPQILIGRNGETLIELQGLLKKILRKKIGQVFFVDLDINDYKKKKTDYLRELAESSADEVSLRKEEIELQPMRPYERRIIHLTLAQRKDVRTESRGERFSRRVVIKPA